VESFGRRVENAEKSEEWVFLVHLAVKRSLPVWRHACLRWVSVSCAICKFHGNIFLPLVRRKRAKIPSKPAREREKGSQLYHHQSFCLKEYIAIKSRKYAFTLANAAISLPLIQHHILCPGTSSSPLFYL